MSPSKRYLQIDEEGYLVTGGLRMGDVDYGYSILKNLRRLENGSFVATDKMSLDHEFEVGIESFDEPFVALQVHKSEKKWQIQMPYDFYTNLNFETLSVDEWDRFHGYSESGIPFVFSRNAQSEFFNLVDEFDDESVTIDSKRYVLKAWHSLATEPAKDSFWGKIYQENPLPPWQLEAHHPAFDDVIKQLKLQKSRVGVFGCGIGYEAAFFSEKGHMVTGFDFSAEAVGRANEKFGHLPSLKFIKSDVLKLPAEYNEQFDVIVEHTCFCAIPPKNRNDLVKSWKKSLSETGYLIGVFFVMDRPEGPPYGATEWEIRERLRKSFDFVYWTRWHFSTERRIGTELVIVARKKS